MSLTENKYIRYFGGHDKRVVTMAMNPADETFLSGRLFFQWHHVKISHEMEERAKLFTTFHCSLDKSIRLWDLRSNHCQVQRVRTTSIQDDFESHFYVIECIQFAFKIIKGRVERSDLLNLSMPIPFNE